MWLQFMANQMRTRSTLTPVTTPPYLTAPDEGRKVVFFLPAGVILSKGFCPELIAGH